jgi:hypothetical protein
VIRRNEDQDTLFAGNRHYLFMITSFRRPSLRG